MLLGRLAIDRLRLDGFDPGATSLEHVPLTHAQLPPGLVASAAATGGAAAVAQLQQAVDTARASGIVVGGSCATTAEFELLLGLGCSFACGPLIAAPLPAAHLAGRVRDWTAPPVAADRAR